MVHNKFALSAAILCGLCSIISGASDEQRRKSFPGGSILLALVAALNAYAAF